MWILPTYNRQDLCQNVLDACVNTRMQSPGIVFISGENEYKGLRVPLNWFVHREINRYGAAAALQKFFQILPNEDYYGILSDDTVPKSLYWDTELVNTCQPCHISFCSDGWKYGRNKNGKLFPSGAVCISGKLARKIGWLALPGTQQYGTDRAWFALSKYADILRYRPDVFIEHLHFRNNKRPRTNGGPDDEKDKLIYKEWVRSELMRTVERLEK